MPKRSLAAILLAAFVLILGLVAAGCGEDDEEPTTGGSGTSQEEEKPAIKVGLVTDIGGLNDRSFNQLANEGLERAESELGVEGRALTSESDADYVPNLSTLAQQKYDLVIGVGFLMSESVNTVAEAVPGHELRDHRLPAGGSAGQAGQRARPAVQGERGRLSRRLPRRAGRQGEGRRPGDLLGRRPEDPAGRRLHRRLPGRCEGGPAGDQDAQRLLAGLRRPGEVQGDRAQPDRGGLAGRLPGRRPVRPRRARRGQGEGRARHRRRRRPGLPRRAHPDLGPEEGRRRRVRDRQGGPGRRLRRAARTRSSTSATTASGSASSTPTASRSPIRWRRSSSRSSTARSPTSRRRSSSGHAEDHADARRQHPPSSCAGSRKRFGSLVANDAIDFELKRGEIHALLGENGAGKSTLMNVLYGLHHPDEGEILLDGEPVTIDSARKAIGLGIGMVHQHFMLVPVMTVAENLVLGTEPSRGPLLDYKEAVRRARSCPSSTGSPCAPRSRSRTSASAPSSAWRSSARCSAAPRCWCSTSRLPSSPRRSRRTCSRCCAR